VFIQHSIAADPLTFLTNSAQHIPKIETEKFKIIVFKRRTRNATMKEDALRQCKILLQNHFSLIAVTKN